VFRLGLDSGFFRVHYDLETEAERRRLAGTVALVIGLAFLIGATAVGWGLEVLLLVGSVAAVARDACAGANLYHLLRRLMASRVTSTHLPPSTPLGRHS